MNRESTFINAPFPACILKAKTKSSSTTGNSGGSVEQRGAQMEPEWEDTTKK